MTRSEDAYAWRDKGALEPGKPNLFGEIYKKYLYSLIRSLYLYILYFTFEETIHFVFLYPMREYGEIYQSKYV